MNVAIIDLTEGAPDARPVISWSVCEDLPEDTAERAYRSPERAAEGWTWNENTEEFTDPTPAPEPARPELPKSTVYGRVKAMGQVPALLTLFAAQPQAAYEWNMPGWPNVFCDDPQMLGALQAIGCTPEEIAAIVAIP